MTSRTSPKISIYKLFLTIDHKATTAIVYLTKVL